MSKTVGKVFISHSSEDKPFVDMLVNDLAAHGIPVWYDKRDLKLGDSITGKINSGLFEAKYFLIVLSPNAIDSIWVQEELNAALMQQIAIKGTFLLPVLISDCELPPLLKHRRYADFRYNYEAGLNELLTFWDKDAGAVSELSDKPLYPWPDTNVSDKEFIYLYSTRLDKFFRMNCEFNWTADRTIEYIVETLKLPCIKNIPELGMRWSFNYGLLHNGRSIAFSSTLCDAGISLGTTIRLTINSTYEDLYEKELCEMWEESKLYEITSAIIREANLRAAIKRRGVLTSELLRQISDSCFSHV